MTQNRSNTRIVFVDGWKRGESRRAEEIGPNGGFDHLAQLTRELQDEETRVVLWTNQEDGYDWKAYGSNKRPLRSGVMKKTDYFKCCNFDAEGKNSCDARKTVQQNDEDSRTSIVVYQGKHNHAAPNKEVLEKMPVLKNLFRLPFDAGMTLRLTEIRNSIRGGENLRDNPHSCQFQPLDANRQHPNPSPYYNARPRKRSKVSHCEPSPCPPKPPSFPSHSSPHVTTINKQSPSPSRCWRTIEESPLARFVPPSTDVPSLESTPPASFTKPSSSTKTPIFMGKSMLSPRLESQRPSFVAPKGSLANVQNQREVSRISLMFVPSVASLLQNP